MLSNIINKISPRAVRKIVDIAIFGVDETIRDQKHIHTELARDHILANVVADHKAILRGNTQAVEDPSVIFQARFAETRIFIAGAKFKFVDFEPRPSHAVLIGNERK